MYLRKQDYSRSAAHSRRALELEDVTGVVAAGKSADLLVVEGDPTADISLLCRAESIRAVVMAGVTHHAGAMHRR